MEPRRLAHLTEPGERLLLATDAPSHAERYAAIVDGGALPEQQVLATPLVAVPLPVKRRSAGPRGWPESINVAALWHPLYWLPERLSFRFRFDDGSVETDEEWAVRVAIEATISELYDPNTGTWLDCLSLVGLDITDEDVQHRLRAWLAGSADPDIDRIDLSGITELPGDPDWALRETAEMLATLVPASWSLMATSLLDELAQPGATDRERIATVANLAIGILGEVPGRTDTEPVGQVQFQRALTGLDQNVAPEAIAEHLTGILRAIQADYLPFLELLHSDMAAADEV